MDIGLLGPLHVDHNGSALGPRDRVVLSALAVRPGDVLSPDQLADALWHEQPPASWPKVVQGCVVRLRKALGSDALETTPHGYRLGDRTAGFRHPRVRAVRPARRRARRRRTPRTRGHRVPASAGAVARSPVRGAAGLGRRPPGGRAAAGAPTLLRGGAGGGADRGGGPRRHRGRAGTRRRGALAGAPVGGARTGPVPRGSTGRRPRLDPAGEPGAPGPPRTGRGGGARRPRGGDPAPGPRPGGRAAASHPGVLPVEGARRVRRGRPGRLPRPRGGDRRVRGPPGTAPDAGPRRAVGLRQVVAPPGRDRSVAAGAGPAGPGDGAPARTRPRRMAAALAGTRGDPVLVVDQFEEVFTLRDDPASARAWLADLASYATERAPVVLAMRADHVAELWCRTVAGPAGRGRAAPGLAAHRRPPSRRHRGTGPDGRAPARARAGRPAAAGQRGRTGSAAAALARPHRDLVASRRSLAHRERLPRRGGIRGAVARSADRLYEELAPDERARLRWTLLRLVATVPGRRAVPHAGAERECRGRPDRGAARGGARPSPAGHGLRRPPSSWRTRRWPGPGHGSARGWTRTRADRGCWRHLAASADGWDALGPTGQRALPGRPARRDRRVAARGGSRPDAGRGGLPRRIPAAGAHLTDGHGRGEPAADSAEPTAAAARHRCRRSARRWRWWPVSSRSTGDARPGRRATSPGPRSRPRSTSP